MAVQMKIGSVVRMDGYAGMTVSSDTPSVLSATLDAKSGKLEIAAKAQGQAAVTLASGVGFNVVCRFEVVHS